MFKGQRGATMFAVVTLAVISHTAFTASRMTVTLAAIHLQAPTYVVGMLLSLYALLPMMLSVSIGRWIDRVGTRIPMLIGAITLGVASIVPTLWLSLPALYINSMSTGVGFLLFHMSVQKLTGELGDDSARMRNFGVLAVGFSVSAFCGPIIAGFLIDSAGHYASFAASFVASALLIATAFALLKWRWRFDGRAPISAPARPINARVFDLLKTPELRRLYLVIVVISSLWDLFMFLVPVQGSNIGLSASQIGFVLAAFAAATFSVRLALPLFVDRLSEWQMIAVVQLVAAGVYLVFPLVTGHYGLVALSFVLGLGLGIGQPAVMSLLHKVTPAGRIGEAVGLRMTMVNGTQTVLPTVFGSVGSLLGTFLSGAFVFAPLFWGMALVSGVSGTSVLRGSRAR